MHNAHRDFLGGSLVKNLPAKQEIQVQSLGQEDSVEEDVTTTQVFLPGNPMNRGDWQATNSIGPVKSNNLRAKQSHTFLYVTLGTLE